MTGQLPFKQSDQISLPCQHEEALDPWLRIVCVAKTDQTGIACGFVDFAMPWLICLQRQITEALMYSI